METAETRRMRRENRIRARREGVDGGFDYSLLLITFCIIGFGMLMIYSASSYSAQVKYDDSTYFLRHQAMNVAVGLVGMLLATRFNYKLFIRPFPLIRLRPITLMYLAAIGMQIAVLLQDSGLNGAKRWLKIGPVSFQPSEFTKLVLIILTAYYIARIPVYLPEWKRLVRVLVPISIPVALIGNQDFSSCCVILASVVGICFVASRRKLPYVGLAGILGLAGYVFIFHLSSSFRADRIAIWLDPEGHPKGTQIVHGLYAIASGGLFGAGLGESMQKLGFLPEPYNDMIFSVICEELGLVGAGVVILMFIILCWRIYTIAMRAPDLFSSLICVGVMIHIATQALVNIAVVTNTIPSTGIPLPFISYGGSSVIFLMVEIGIVLGISAKTGQEGEVSRR